MFLLSGQRKGKLDNHGRSSHRGTTIEWEKSKFILGTRMHLQFSISCTNSTFESVVATEVSIYV